MYPENFKNKRDGLVTASTITLTVQHIPPKQCIYISDGREMLLTDQTLSCFSCALRNRMYKTICKKLWFLCISSLKQTSAPNMHCVFNPVIIVTQNTTL